APRTSLLIWAKRFVNVAVYGYAVAEGGWWLGIPGGIYAIILKAVALVLAILAVVFVLQNRAGVAEWLRGREGAVLSGRRWRLMRGRLADTWHVVSILYLAAIYSVYALRITGGFFYVGRATLLSVVIIVAARLIVGLARRLSRRGFAVSTELKAKFPALEARANRYLPLLTAAV